MRRDPGDRAIRHTLETVRIMEIHAGLDVSQRTRLILTARMQQSLSLLQAPGVELGALLRDALDTNPFLEEEPSRDHGEGTESSALPRAPWGSEQRAARVRPLLAREPWTTDILRQMRLRSAERSEAALAEYLLGCLDGRGYLALPRAEIARACGVARSHLERVRQVILRLDPPGLGAVDLKECLAVQLEASGEGAALARRIIADGLEDLASDRIDHLAERLSATPAEIRAAAARIRGLWPCPRQRVEPADAHPVFPDLNVVKAGGGYRVTLNEQLFPGVRLVPPSAALLRRRDPELRAFMVDRVTRARWLLANLDARRRTLIAIMELIIEEQREFFTRGVLALRPLGYRRLADRLGLHESTVARAVRGKNVQTPRGIFRLRFFFAKGLGGCMGDDHSPAGVQARLGELIAGEDARRPWTDESLRRLLRGSGVRVSRRTVAKYRDRMRIPKAAYRRGGWGGSAADPGGGPASTTA